MCLKRLGPGILNNCTFDARDSFEELFAALLNTRALPDSPKKLAARGSTEHAGTPDSKAPARLKLSVANQLQSLVQADAKKLFALPRHSRYSRHIIGTDGEWIGVICRWEPHVSSPIHGHPSFAYYQVLEGKFLMDLYATTDEGVATHTESKPMGEGDCIWKRGKPGCYDNLVHKVSTHDTSGFTLHLFSENPSRGQHFAAC